MAQRSKIMSTKIVSLIGALALTVCASISTFAGYEELKVDLRSNGIGVAPADFDFWQTGGGGPGRWAVVRDPSAAAEVAIEQFSDDRTEGRYPIAIYMPVSFKNVAVSARIKLIEGTMQTAGLAFRLTTPGNYYAVGASVLEERVDFYRFVEGKRQWIASVDVRVTRRNWHTLKVIAEENRFTVFLDTKRLFSASDSSFLNEGHIALWTEEDNVTRFEEITITQTPSGK